MARPKGFHVGLKSCNECFLRAYQRSVAEPGVNRLCVKCNRLYHTKRIHRSYQRTVEATVR